MLGIAAVAVVAVVAVAAVVFILPSDKSARDLLPDVNSFPDLWGAMDNEKLDADEQGISSAHVGTYFGPGSKMTVRIFVFDSVNEAKTYCSNLQTAAAGYSPTGSVNFAIGFTYSYSIDGYYYTEQVFQYKSVVGWLTLRSDSPDPFPWGSVFDNIVNKIDSAKNLV